MSSSLRIGFISTRFHGTDGVSLETAKWAQIFEEMGHTCYYFAGKLDTPEDRSYLFEEAFFDHPDVLDLQKHLFGVSYTRTREITSRIQLQKEFLKDHLYAFIEKFKLNLIIPQNIFAIPMHVPLGMALTEVIAETRVPTIAHHHDFVWERERFIKNAVPDYLEMAFPPPFAVNFEHVVINSTAQAELARRRGIPSTLIPNVLDFQTPPEPVDGHARDFREEFEIRPDEILVLQPTRVVTRKGIEHAIELVHQLQSPQRKVCLVVSHDAGDEGLEYYQLLKERAREAQIRMLFISERIAEDRHVDDYGRKSYTLWDFYPHADFVTYPSKYEGFGNAFLEAVYFRKPVLVNRYSIYTRDIEPLGFKVIAMDGIVTHSVVKSVGDILGNPDQSREWADHNYELCLKHFSYDVLRSKLRRRLAALFGE